jgi:hypothetical protein
MAGIDLVHARAVNAPELTAAEIRELYFVHASLPAMNAIPFLDCLRDPTLLLCLRNTLEARRRRRAKIKADVAAEPFELTP